MYGDFGMGVGGGFMWVFWIGLFALLFWALHSPTGNADRPHPSPRELLDERFARGEIDADEYHQRRKDLANP